MDKDKAPGWGSSGKPIRLKEVPRPAGGLNLSRVFFVGEYPRCDACNTHAACYGTTDDWRHGYYCSVTCAEKAVTNSDTVPIYTKMKVPPNVMFDIPHEVIARAAERHAMKGDLSQMEVTDIEIVSGTSNLPFAKPSVASVTAELSKMIPLGFKVVEVGGNTPAELGGKIYMPGSTTPWVKPPPPPAPTPGAEPLEKKRRDGDAEDV